MLSFKRKTNFRYGKWVKQFVLCKIQQNRQVIAKKK